MAKRLEHIRRFFADMPRRVWVCLLCCACLWAACAFIYYRGNTVTIRSNDGVHRIINTVWQTPSRVARAAGVKLGEHDTMLVQHTGNGTLEMHVLRAFAVQVNDAGEESTAYATGGTVAQLLADMGVPLSATDYTEPKYTQHLTADTGTVTVHRVEYKEAEYSETIPFEIEYQETSLFYRNQARELVVQTGVDGYRSEQVMEKYVDGELVGYETLAMGTENREVQNEIIKIYGAGAPISRVEAPEGVTVVDGVPQGGSYTLLSAVKATGYYSARGRGSSGLGLYYGTFAVDPTLIPYGTKVYIASADGRFVYGWAIATDTGTFIYSNRWQVDLFYESYAESAINGVQTVNVYVPTGSYSG